MRLQSDSHNLLKTTTTYIMKKNKKLGKCFWVDCCHKNHKIVVKKKFISLKFLDLTFAGPFWGEKRCLQSNSLVFLGGFASIYHLNGL